MTISLPKPIASYFAAEQAEDASALARCFTDEGVVRDEGGTFTGTTAIERWNADARAKYHHTVVPLSVAEDGFVPIARVTEAEEEVTTLPFASRTSTLTAGVIAPPAVVFEGWTLKASLFAAPASTLSDAVSVNVPSVPVTV